MSEAEIIADSVKMFNTYVGLGKLRYLQMQRRYHLKRFTGLLKALGLHADCAKLIEWMDE